MTRPILRYLATVPDASATEVAEALEMSVPAAGMALLRLARSGLAVRSSDPGRGCLFYALTPKGKARLAFFETRRL
ncbi:MAG: MarR family transcriptional regulator [Alphaproteobacteria bacterium]